MNPLELRLPAPAPAAVSLPAGKRIGRGWIGREDQAVLVAYVNDPLSSGMVWLRLIRGAYLLGLPVRRAVAFLGACLVLRSSSSDCFRRRVFVRAVGLFSGFSPRTCLYYLDILTNSGFLLKSKEGGIWVYRLTPRGESAQRELLGKADEVLHLRNQLLKDWHEQHDK